MKSFQVPEGEYFFIFFLLVWLLRDFTQFSSPHDIRNTMDNNNMFMYTLYMYIYILYYIICVCMVCVYDMEAARAPTRDSCYYWQSFFIGYRKKMLLLVLLLFCIIIHLSVFLFLIFFPCVFIQFITLTSQRTLEHRYEISKIITLRHWTSYIRKCMRKIIKLMFNHLNLYNLIFSFLLTPTRNTPKMILHRKRQICVCCGKIKFFLYQTVNSPSGIIWQVFRLHSLCSFNDMQRSFLLFLIFFS